MEEKERIVQSEGPLVQWLETRERVMALCGQHRTTHWGSGSGG